MTSKFIKEVGEKKKNTKQQPGYEIVYVIRD